MAMKRLCCFLWVGKWESTGSGPDHLSAKQAGPGWASRGAGRILGPESAPLIHAYRSPSGQCPVGAQFSAHFLPQVPLLWRIEQPPDAHMRYLHQSSVKLKSTIGISWRQTLCAHERVPGPPEGCFGDSLNCFAAHAFKAPGQQLRLLLFTATLSSPPTPWSLAGRQSQQRVTDVHAAVRRPSREDQGSAEGRPAHNTAFPASLRLSITLLAPWTLSPFASVNLYSRTD